VKIPDESGGNALVRTVLDDRGTGRQAYYWYDIDGRPVLNKYAAKLVSVANGIFRRRTNAALVVFVADPQGGRNLVARRRPPSRSISCSAPSRNCGNS